MIVRNAVKMKIVVLLILCAVLHAGATVAVKMFSFDEGLSDGNLTKPRIYIKNIGTEAISNFTYRYYFTTEGTEAPIVEDYWTPNESITLVSLGNNHYYVKYALAVTLNPGQMSPENSGCVIGIHYNSWGPWDKTNDCSNTRTTTFVENPRIEVYNSSGTRIYGDVLSCSIDGGGDTLPPQDMALNSFALFSTTSTKVQANTIFTGGGALGSNGEVEVGAGSQVTGNIVSGQNAILRANAVVNGDVFAENTITTFNGTFVKGICHENAQVAELTIPQKTVANGTVDKTIASYTTITLSPGNYKNCTVQTNGTLILLPGLYTFYNLNVQKKGKVQINAASNQLVQVDITADLEFYDSCEVKFQTHGYSPAVRFYTNDANTIRIGYGAKVIGILSAPLANLTMYAGSRCDGAIYAKQITIEQGASMASEDVNIESDADGDGVPNGVEILSGSDPASSTSFKLIAIPHPGVIDNTVASTVTYDLARFSPEYASSGTATLAVPARALKNGVSNVLMKVSNKPVDFDGSVVTGSQLPSTSNYATRFFSFKSGIFMPSAQITLTVPIVANDIGVTNYTYDYYNDATNSWVTGSAPEIIEVEGVPTFRLAMTAPKILVVHEKITSDVAYLDGGTILTSSKEMSDVAVNFNITGVASDAIASYQIHYDDYNTTPASPKEFQGSFSRTEIDGVSSLQCDFSEGAISSTAKIVIKRVVITSSENITYDYSNTEYTVLPGQRVTLKADAKPVCYATSSGRDPVAVLYDNNYVLESFDLDGEGRIKKSSAGTGFTYDYFIRDNLGSTRMVVNDNGDVREANLYKGYGKIIPLYSQNGYSTVRDKFTGKEFDTESGLGLFYFGARYYDPDLGVWTSTDPMDQYWNAYSYCGADPVNRVDEWGLDGETPGYTPNPGHTDNPTGPISIWTHDPGLPNGGTPPTPVTTGPNRTIVSNENRDGLPTVVSTPDLVIIDYDNNGNLDEEDIEHWFDNHDLGQESFNKFIRDLKKNNHFIFAALVGGGKGVYDVYKTVRRGKFFTKNAAKKSDDANDAVKSSRAARRDAMRKSNDPTSRPATQQKINGDNKQYVTEGSDGKPRVQTNHEADKEHPNNHWHNAQPKTDPATGEILEGNYGEWKYKSGGTSSSYGN